MRECKHEWKRYEEFLDSQFPDHKFCIKCGIDKEVALQQQNTQLKSDIQALRKRMKDLEWCGVPGNDICYVCNGDRKHNEGCWVKAELDKLEDKP